MNTGLAIGGLDVLRGWLRKAAGRLRDRAALHARVGRTLTGWVDANFDADGRLATGTSAGWPPLRARTLAARRRAGLGTRPLQATGRLRAGVRLRSDAASATLDDPVPYAAVHQLGLGVPARPFLPTRTQTARIARPVAEAFVREALR
ncbi:MAG TPA: phage virion morphogenesis protein [bacterium]|nr:phage virion morphogenesis protein [bacterium]